MRERTFTGKEGIPKAEELRSEQTHCVIHGHRALVSSLSTSCSVASAPFSLSRDSHWERDEKSPPRDTVACRKSVLLS